MKSVSIGLVLAAILASSITCDDAYVTLDYFTAEYSTTTYHDYAAVDAVSIAGMVIGYTFMGLLIFGGGAVIIYD